MIFKRRLTFKVNHHGYSPDAVTEVPEDHPEARLTSSLMPSGRHAPLLDLDGLGARLVPSSTPGNFHLFLDNVALTTEQYQRLLDALVEAGIVQPGYAKQLGTRGATFARIRPTKGQPDDLLPPSETAPSVSSDVFDGEPF